MKNIQSITVLFYLLLISFTIALNGQSNSNGSGLKWTNFEQTKFEILDARFFPDENSFIVVGLDSLKKINLAHFNKEGKLIKEYDLNIQVAFVPGTFKIINRSELFIAGVQQLNETICLAKIDLSGNQIIWEHELLGNFNGNLQAICPYQSDSFILSGSIINDKGNTDALVLSVDDEGKVLWFKSFGSPEGNDVINDVNVAENGFVLTGTTDPFGTNQDYAYMLKIDSIGELIWDKTLGGQKESQQGLEIFEIDSTVTFFGKRNNGFRIIEFDEYRDIKTNYYSDDVINLISIQLLESHSFILMAESQNRLAISTYNPKLLPNSPDSSKIEKIEIDSMPTTEIYSQLNGQIKVISQLGEPTVMDFTRMDNSYDLDSFTCYKNHPIQVEVKCSKGSYIYLFSINSKNRIKQHFPRQNVSKPMDSLSQILPAVDTVLILSTDGTEKLILLNSFSPVLEPLEFLKEKMNATPDGFSFKNQKGFIEEKKISWDMNRIQFTAQVRQDDIIPVVLKIPVSENDKKPVPIH